MPEYGPASLPFVASLASIENVESQRILLRITVDHFSLRADHSPQRLAYFEKAMLRLIAKVDATTRLNAARKIARHPQTPPRVLSMIEEMGGEGSLHVLECAPLPRERLAAAAFGHESRACAVARRPDLDASLIGALSMRTEPEIALTLVNNASASLDPQTFAALARRAEREKPLGAALLARRSSGLDSASLFLLATSDQRAQILAEAQRAELGRASTVAHGPGHEEAIARLERYALEREAEQFIDALSSMLGCARDLAERIAKEPSGEALAVALAALDAPQDVAVRILISGDLLSGARYTRLGALIRLRDGLNPAAARRVIAALSGAHKSHAGQHRPVLDPNAAPTPSRAAATPLNSSGRPSPQRASTPSVLRGFRKP